MAAHLRHVLDVPVRTHPSPRYGEFQVLVDGREVIRGTALAFLGVIPAMERIVAAVGSALAEPGGMIDSVRRL